MEKRVVIITGANSGIGKAAATIFAKAGYKMALLMLTFKMANEYNHLV